jgi:hypothetical protein
MTRTLRLCAAIGLWFLAVDAFAQGRRPVPMPKYELDVGVAWIGRTTYGSADANLTNGSGGTQPLFTTTNERAAGPALEAHLSTRLAAHIRAEVTGAWQRAELRTTTSVDFEGAEAATLALPVSSFAIEGSGVFVFRPRSRFDPFLRGGVGWVRDLTEGSVLAKDGTIANVGGGVKYWWSPRAGLRSEVRAVIRSGGLELSSNARRVSPAVTVSLAFRF